MADATPSDDVVRREENPATSPNGEQDTGVLVVARTDYTAGDDADIGIEPPEVEEEVKSPSAQTSSGGDTAEHASVPPYLATIKDFSIQTVCIKGYERRTTATFPREEFYAYRVVSIVNDVTSSEGEAEVDLPSGTEDRRWELDSRFKVLAQSLMDRKADRAEERRRARQSVTPQQGDAAQTRLQFRLPYGGSVVEQFGSSSTLGDARELIVEHLQCRPSQIVLSGTFPSRVLGEEDDDQTLVELGLAPLSVILVRNLRKPVSARPSGSGGGVLGSIAAALMWLVSLVVTLFKSLGSLLPSPAAPPGDGSGQGPPPQQEPREGRFVRQNWSSGSHFRHIKQNDGEDDEDSDERRKTDNGNSTQQQ